MLEATQTGGESDTSVDTDTDSSVATPPRPEVEPDSTADDETVEPLPLDITFEILKNRRRRLVLEYIRDVEETTTIGELAEHIAAIENDTTVQQLNAQQRKRVYIGLYQCHLPKMDDAGVIEFNQDRGRIDVGQQVEPLYKYLDIGEEAEEEDETTFHTTHVGGAVGFSTLFFIAQFSGAYTMASGIIVAFLLVTLAVTYRMYT